MGNCIGGSTLPSSSNLGNLPKAASKAPDSPSVTPPTLATLPDDLQELVARRLDRSSQKSLHATNRGFRRATMNVLTTLNLQARDIDDLQTRVARCPGATDISIKGFGTDFDARLSRLASADAAVLKRITSLDLSGRPDPFGGRRLSDATLNHLVGMTGLRNLALDQHDITDGGLAALRGMNAMQHLAVTDGDVLSDKGLKHLEGMTDMRSIDLQLSHRRDGGDAGLVHLRSMPKLEKLKLSGRWLTDAGMAHLDSFAEMKELHLHFTNVSNAALPQLRNMRGLGSLQMVSVTNSISEVNGENLAPLQSLLELEKLDLFWNGRVTDPGLAHIAGLTKLHSLRLSGNEELSDAGIARLSELSGLRALTLFISDGDVDGNLPVLDLLPNLETLEVNCATMTPSRIAALRGRGIEVSDPTR